MKVYNANSLPKSVGAYSQLIETDSVFFTSGQLGIDVASGELVGGGIADETKKIMDNITNLLKELNSNFSKIIKTSVFLTDMAKFNDFNSVYASYFKDLFPARTTVEVNKLAKNASIEIDFMIEK